MLQGPFVIADIRFHTLHNSPSTFQVAIGPIVTSITLEHTLFPPGITSAGSLPTPSSVPPEDWNLPLPIKNDTVQRDLGEVKNCGRPTRSNVNLLVAKGDRIQAGDWPWLVAIFVSRIQLEFQCAGSLVTNRHVITGKRTYVCPDSHRQSYGKSNYI